MRFQELLAFAFKFLLIALEVTLFSFNVFARTAELVKDHCFDTFAKLRI